MECYKIYYFRKGDWGFPQKGGTYILFRCLQDFGHNSNGAGRCFFIIEFEYLSRCILWRGIIDKGNDSMDAYIKDRVNISI